MADTGWLSGTTSAEDSSDGSLGWSGSSYSELLSADAVTCGSGGDQNEPTMVAQLVIGGARAGVSNGVTVPLDTPAYNSAGGASDKWSLTPTRGQCVASDFGVAVQIIHAFGYYWGLVTNFSASIPSGSTIDGIEVRVKSYKSDLGENSYDIQVDHVQVKIYYTEGGGGAPDTTSMFQMF